MSEYHPLLLDMFWWFVDERQRIWQKRAVGEPAPWTDDGVLATYRFTNVYRRLDVATQYVIEEICHRQNVSDEDILFNLMLFRFFNRPDVHAHIGFQLVAEFDADNVMRLLLERQSAGNAIMPNTYKVILQHKEYSTNLERLVYGVIRDGIHANISSFLTAVREAASLYDIWEAMKQLYCVSNFLATQITLDIGYSRLHDCDVGEFVIPGPGAKLAVDLLLLPVAADVVGVLKTQHTGHRHKGADYRNAAVYDRTKTVISDLWRSQRAAFSVRNITFQFYEKEEMCAADIEHALCEFYKYLKLQYDESYRARKFIPRQRLFVVTGTKDVLRRGHNAS